MTILIGNAPCSWGVEFANDERNPAWTTVLDECAEAGYRGIELGPVGFMPEDPDVLGSALESRNLALIGGVVFRAFHDPEVKRQTIANRTDFYEACGNGIFCNLGKGEVNFKEVRQLLEDSNFEGWCTVEQDCDPRLQISPMDDARNNRQFLQSIGFV